MSNILFILSGIAAASVVAILLAGLLVMAKGGEADKKRSNKLMQARVVMQGVTIALFILAMVTNR